MGVHIQAQAHTHNLRVFPEDPAEFSEQRAKGTGLLFWKADQMNCPVLGRGPSNLPSGVLVGLMVGVTRQLLTIHAAPQM